MTGSIDAGVQDRAAGKKRCLIAIVAGFVGAVLREVEVGGLFIREDG
jgi:hypothetical protein